MEETEVPGEKHLDNVCQFVLLQLKKKMYLMDIDGYDTLPLNYAKTICSHPLL
jgi:hypothetical protein